MPRCAAAMRWALPQPRSRAGQGQQPGLMHVPGARVPHIGTWRCAWLQRAACRAGPCRCHTCTGRTRRPRRWACCLQFGRYRPAAGLVHHGAPRLRSNPLAGTPRAPAPLAVARLRQPPAGNAGRQCRPSSPVGRTWAVLALSAGVGRRTLVVGAGRPGGVDERDVGEVRVGLAEEGAGGGVAALLAHIIHACVQWGERWPGRALQRVRERRCRPLHWQEAVVRGSHATSVVPSSLARALQSLSDWLGGGAGGRCNTGVC